MNIYKKIVVSLLIILNIFLYVMGIGYFIIGASTPTQIAGKTVHFLGSYFICVIYLIIAVLVTIILILLLKKWLKNK